MKTSKIQHGMLSRVLLCCLSLLLAPNFYGQTPNESSSNFQTDTAGAGTEQIKALTEKHEAIPIELRNGESIATKASFKPPIEITIVAKTDSTNLRISYAADQVIFNWEKDRGQLRIDGGPANGNHKIGRGFIPTHKYVTIRWVVTPDSQKIYVDNDLRFEHHGDYSHIDNPIRVFPGAKSMVSVISIKTKSL